MCRVNGNLNLSRAIGDLKYKANSGLPAKDQIISAEPDIRHVTLCPDDRFFLLACDGVWDVMTNQARGCCGGASHAATLRVPRRFACRALRPRRVAVGRRWLALGRPVAALNAARVARRSLRAAAHLPSKPAAASPPTHLPSPLTGVRGLHLGAARRSATVSDFEEVLPNNLEFCCQM